LRGLYERKKRYLLLFHIIKKYNQGYLVKRLANYFLTFLFNLKTKSKLTDINTCYKLFKKDVLKDLELVENRFVLDPEITLKLTKKILK